MKKVGHSRPLFIYFCLFNTVDNKQIFNINFANDLIQTSDLWYWKRPLYQLSHNHCLESLLYARKLFIRWTTDALQLQTSEKKFPLLWRVVEEDDFSKERSPLVVPVWMDAEALL